MRFNIPWQILVFLVLANCRTTQEAYRGPGKGGEPGLPSQPGSCQDAAGGERPDGSKWVSSLSIKSAADQCQGKSVLCSCAAGIVACKDESTGAAVDLCPTEPVVPPKEDATSSFDSEALCLPNGLASDRLKHTLTCETLGQSYGTGAVSTGQSTYRPAHVHGDLNLFVRGFHCHNQIVLVPKTPSLATVGNVFSFVAWDPMAPRIQTMFAAGKEIQFANLYSTLNWRWELNGGNGARSGGLTGQVEVGGLKAQKGELIHVPSSGYDIGGGFEVVVLYASPSTITLKYTRDDNIVGGYGLHFTGICVDPELVALFEKLKDSGQRPALRARQAFAKAIGNEVQVSVRDTGSFMNVTSRHDWFQEDKFDK